MKTPTLILLVAGLAACTHTETPREAFEARVQPILERTCAASTCHGVTPGAEARGEQIDWTQLYFKLGDDGKFSDVDQAYRAAKHAINTVEDPAFSPLLRKALAKSHGGLGHLGGTSFGSPSDPDYKTIYDWISLEAEGGADPLPLSEREQLFADTVQPVLVEGTCMTSRCHGPTAGGTPYKLDVGYEGRFPIEATRNNYKETLRMVTLDGYPMLSRVLRKSLPLGPGIIHKALNFDFFADNPGGGIPAITSWICAERRARTGHDCASPDQPPIRGFVFVRGPILPRHAFDLEGFTPGSDLYLAKLEGTSLIPISTENLTEALHPEGPADVRGPAVSRDGKRVVFAMRTRAEEGHHLWTIDLASREAHQLTFGNGPMPGGGLATDRDPTWGPDETVWFTSTRAGVVADQGRLLDAEIYSLDPATSAVRRWTYTPHIERRPVFFDLGDEAGGEVAFSALRDAIPGQARAHVFRFPPSQSTEYHQHFGITPVQTFFYDMQELPDGRYVSVVGDLPAVWESGQLAIIDRNFGPEINERAADPKPALEMYKPPMVLLAGDGVYRDPMPLPDGRVLVAHQPEPFDGQDGAATFTPRIELLELQEAPDGSGPFIAATSTLLAEPGVALTEPRPISIRGPVRLDAPPLPPSQGATATFRHQGLPMVDAMLSNLPPAGVKHPRDDVAFVRLVEHLPMTPSGRSPIPAEDADSDPSGQATSAALGVHGPARVLAELPVEPDGSFQVQVPTDLPFRVQSLNADRMAVGTMHNRWYYTLGGQVLTQGISAATGTVRYSSQCGACHGDPNGIGGKPLDLEAPDAVTGASLSLSRFIAQNPRRPITPTVVGPTTRIEVDFRRDVQPILERRCVGCHGESSPAAGLRLTSTPTTHYTMAYEELLKSGSGSGNDRAYVDDGDGRARLSYLVELVTGRELDAPRALTKPGSPHPPAGQGTGSLTEDELLVLIRWIELGATFQGLSQGSTP